MVNAGRLPCGRGVDLPSTTAGWELVAGIEKVDVGVPGQHQADDREADRSSGCRQTNEALEAASVAGAEFSAPVWRLDWDRIEQL